MLSAPERAVLCWPRVNGPSGGRRLLAGSALGPTGVPASGTANAPPALLLRDIPGGRVHRRRIDLADGEAFSGRRLRAVVDLRGARWVRLEAWDVAANGAFSQPVWLE